MQGPKCIRVERTQGVKVVDKSFVVFDCVTPKERRGSRGKDRHRKASLPAPHCPPQLLAPLALLDLGTWFLKKVAFVCSLPSCSPGILLRAESVCSSRMYASLILRVSTKGRCPGHSKKSCLSLWGKYPQFQFNLGEGLSKHFIPIIQFAPSKNPRLPSKSLSSPSQLGNTSLLAVIMSSLPTPSSTLAPTPSLHISSYS